MASLAQVAVPVEASATRRNYVASSHRKDDLIEWMRGMLYHSFALSAPESYGTTFRFFEELIDEFRANEASKFNTVVSTSSSSATSDASEKSVNQQLLNNNSTTASDVLFCASVAASQPGGLSVSSAHNPHSSVGGHQVRTLTTSASRLAAWVPSCGPFHTNLPLEAAFREYDEKYSISRRHFIPPSFHEVRHILNKAQVSALGRNLRFISFDGDQTLYSDGGNFEANNDELSLAIIRLLNAGVKVAVITAAGYGDAREKYEHRLRGLLQRFDEEQLSEESVNNFLLFGGECNYLFRCRHEDRTVIETSPGVWLPISEEQAEAGLVTGETRVQRMSSLVYVTEDEWQNPALNGPRPRQWPKEELQLLLDTAEETMKHAISELQLRARIIRKERSVGLIPGGQGSIASMPVGHGSKKLKQEALDEVVLRIVDQIRQLQNRISVPYCVFNGGTDAWLDVGDKGVAIAALQSYFQLSPAECLHVGDQFLSIGNDIAARQYSACIWILNPRETGKILQQCLVSMGLPPITNKDGLMQPRLTTEGEFDPYTGKKKSHA